MVRDFIIFLTIIIVGAIVLYALAVGRVVNVVGIAGLPREVIVSGASPCDKLSLTKRHVVVVTTKDNIGNQLFQAAHAFAYTSRHKGLDEVCLIGPMLSRPILSRLASNVSNISMFHCADPVEIVQSRRSLTEKGYSFATLPPPTDAHNAALDEPLYLNGYYQSYKYFSNVASSFIKACLPSPSIRSHINTSLTSVWAKSSFSMQPFVIGVHIRVGDYAKFAHYHTNLPEVYYVQALQVVMASGAIKSGRPVVVCIFGDSRDAGNNLAKKLMLAFRGRVDIAEFVRVKGQPEVDMWAMASTDALICANSSFSWWAGLLGSELHTTKRIVVLPHKWFGIAGPSHYSDVFGMGPKVDVRVVGTMPCERSRWMTPREAANKAHVTPSKSAFDVCNINAAAVFVNTLPPERTLTVSNSTLNLLVGGSLVAISFKPIRREWNQFCKTVASKIIVQAPMSTRAPLSLGSRESDKNVNAKRVWREFVSSLTKTSRLSIFEAKPSTYTLAHFLVPCKSTESMSPVRSIRPNVCATSFTAVVQRHIAAHPSIPLCISSLQLCADVMCESYIVPSALSHATSDKLCCTDISFFRA